MGVTLSIGVVQNGIRPMKGADVMLEGALKVATLGFIVRNLLGALFPRCFFAASRSSKLFEFDTDGIIVSL